MAFNFTPVTEQSNQQESIESTDTFNFTSDEDNISIIEDALNNVDTTDVGLNVHPTAERDALAFAFKLGSTDTGRGVSQFLSKIAFGENSAVGKEDQEKLRLMEDQYGGKITAAYYAGLFADPGGMVLPFKRADTILKTAANAVPGGIWAGSTGYVEEGMDRSENMLFGAAGAFTLQGGMSKISQSLGPVLGDLWKKHGAEPINNAVGSFGKFLQNNPKTKPAVDSFGEWFIDNYGLPPAFVKLKKTKRITQNEIISQFNDVIKKTLDMSPEEQQLMYLVSTGRINETLPSNLAKITEQGRLLVDDLGQQMVDLGMLSAKTYNKNKGSYLHRSFANTSDPLVKKGISNPKDILLLGDEFKMRGRTETVPLNEAQEWIEKGYKIVRGSTNKHNHTVKINRDWTEKELAKMGEIKNFAYALAETGRLMNNDISYYKFLDSVKKDFSSPTMMDGYVQVPRGGGVKGSPERWGNLAGQYVPKRIYDDMNRGRWFNEFINSNKFTRSWVGLQSWWKRSKTSLNPVTHVNNIMSNVMLYDFVDGDMRMLSRAALDLKKMGTDLAPDDLKLAERLGVFQADQMSQELTRLERDIYNVYVRPITTGATDGGLVNGLINRTKQVGNATKQYLKKTHLDRLYQAEDNVFRYGLFKTRLAAGDSAEEAAMFARKYMLDYEIDAPAIQALRQTTHPFIAYTYRALPILGETMVNKPWKIAKWSGLLYGINKYGELDVTPEQVKEERKLLNENQKGFKFFGLPGLETMVRLPGRGGEYIDTKRWFAGMDVMDAGQGAYEIPYVPAVFEPSGGFVSSLYSGMTGIDFFSGKQIPGTVADTPIAFKKQLEATAKGLLPPWLGGYAWDKFIRGVDPEEHITKQDYTTTEAALNLFGVKKFTLNPDLEMKNVSGNLKAQVADLKRLIKKNSIEIRSTSYKWKQDKLHKENKEAERYIKKLVEEFQGKELSNKTKLY